MLQSHRRRQRPLKEPFLRSSGQVTGGRNPCLLIHPLAEITFDMFRSIAVWCSVVFIGSRIGLAADLTLVSASNTWHMHKGLTAPVTGWQTLPEAQLTNWLQAPGGFGYSSDSAPETALCGTLLNDMEDNYKSVYIRRTFQSTGSIAPDARLFLRMDFDDGFVAWLDGQYLTNIYAPGAPAEPAYDASATTSRESSLGNSSPQPARTFDLGPAATWLTNGEHVLAIMGLNNSSGSSDFILVPRLYVASPLTNVLSGMIASDTTLRASQSPYVISGALTISNDVTLTIEPGVQLQFDADASLTVSARGRLLAEGTAESPIGFVRPSDESAPWGNIVILGGVGSPENRISHAFLEGNGESPCIHVDGGSAYLSHLEFRTRTYRYLDLDDSSFIVSHCYFPGTIGNREPIHGTGGIKQGGHGIIQNCYFGPITGYNDTIDFTGGNRPGPILQALNNVFAGTGDDNLDLDSADAWVQGNIFLHAHKNGSPDTSSPVSGGNDDGQNGDVTIMGNIFYDCDHAVMAKQGNFYTLLNNTIVRQTKQGGTDDVGALLCVQDNNMTEGRGMYFERNVIWDIEQLTRNVTNAVITFTNNFMPLPWTGPGAGNSLEDPLFVHVPAMDETVFTNWADAQIIKQWLSLRTNSPARRRGEHATDAGAAIPFGVALTALPDKVTTAKDATLWVGPNRRGSGIPVADWPQGAGYTHYKWRLDAAVWSDETSALEPIVLTNLTVGPHLIEVVGKNDAGFYQNDPRFEENAVVTSYNWTVLDHAPALSISLAAGAVELRFPSSPGAAYDVEFCDALAPTTSWQVLTNLPVQAVAGELKVRDSNPSAGARFYRVLAR